MEAELYIFNYILVKYYKLYTEMTTDNGYLDIHYKVSSRKEINTVPF